MTDERDDALARPSQPHVPPRVDHPAPDKEPSLVPHQTAAPVAPPDVTTASRSTRRALTSVVALLLVGGLGVWMLNYVLLTLPVKTAVERDMRDERFALTAHYGNYVEPSHLTLDMRNVESISPVGAFRALFDAADTLAAAGRRFDHVTLAYNGQPRFILSGDDFHTLGVERSGGQNPIYMIRTLPEKLRLPDGTTHAYGTWEGGIFGVLAKQMNDATDAGKAWVRDN